MTSVNRPADVPLLDLVVALRAAVNIHPLDVPVSRFVPRNVDLRATLPNFEAVEWLRWCVGTSQLFAEGWPTLEIMRSTTSETLIVMAMERGKGSLTDAAKRLHTSRRVVREHLKKAGGLYPWPRKS